MIATERGCFYFVYKVFGNNNPDGTIYGSFLQPPIDNATEKNNR